MSSVGDAMKQSDGWLELLEVKRNLMKTNDAWLNHMWFDQTHKGYMRVFISFPKGFVDFEACRLSDLGMPHMVLQKYLPLTPQRMSC